MLGTTVSIAFEEASCELDKVKGPDLSKNSQKNSPYQNSNLSTNSTFISNVNFNLVTERYHTP